MTRSIASFKSDLERLYRLGYRPISMKEYLDNRINVPIGKSPCILTFDDSRGSQFRMRSDDSVDPNCAIGIMQAFAKRYPDFPVKATFFVLPTRVFDQPDKKAEKIDALLKMGCEIGNHTVKHPNLRRLSDARVQEEIAMNIKMVQELVPGTPIETLALPMGVLPKNKKLLAAGEANGFQYTNRAALLAGANPAYSPVSVKFDTWRIPRILAYDVPMGISYWLDELKMQPGMRYISDGDPMTVTVPRLKEKMVNPSRLAGAQLRTY
jgi:peptidoglycan/xylan/chitin deacetylase (PgdA/CDA1 family)